MPWSARLPSPAVERFGRDGPAERWRARREEIHREVLREGFDPTRRTFTRAYGSRELDGALLMPAYARTVWSCATAPTVTGMVFLAARAPSCPARSGWSTTSR